MLAGRKLLLADDSLTIQKVVDLTFADEGVKVISVGNGREAVERLEQIAPDIVLADVFMPEMSGYEVCEYIKQNDKLKHIPVMLLVGSFEPFDEAEARRVGADDILTKPFQSIRKLIDKVGGLMGAAKTPEMSSTQDLPKANEAETAELPKMDVSSRQPEELSTEELQVTTADTQQLPGDLRSAPVTAGNGAPPQSMWAATPRDDHKMETSSTAQQESNSSNEPADGLLDLGEFESAGDSISEEFVLDIDINDVDEPQTVAPMFSAAGNFVEPAVVESHVDAREKAWEPIGSESYVDKFATAPPIVDRLAETQEFTAPAYPSAAPEYAPQRVSGEPEDLVQAAPGDQQFSMPSGKITLEQLSPEVIEAIARRAVEMLSDKAVREIAWEVVPQLSELIIKRQLEEKS